MSGLMDKAKDALGKATSSKSGQDNLDKYTAQGVDQATDRLGMGDKYDQKISDFADKEINKELGNNNPASNNPTGGPNN